MHNQGVGDADLTINSTPSFGSGKIGNALISGGKAGWTAEQTEKILNNSELSICFWVYVDAPEGDTSKREMFFGNNDTRKFSLFQYPTCNDFHWSWKPDADTGNKGSAVLNVFPSYKWTHCAITYKNPYVNVYINGENVVSNWGQAIMNWDSYADSTYVIHSCPYRKLNDYRVYDNCLSPREVKEISKGLVCHYTLSGVGGENLLRNTNTGATYWYWSGNGGTRTATATEDGGVKLTAVAAANSGSWSVIEYDDRDFKTLLKPSTIYTASLDIYPPCSTNFGFTVLNGNGTEGLTTATVYCPIKEGRWNHCEWTFTTKDTLTMSNQIIYMTGISPTIQGYEIYLKNIKVEEGSRATPWTPNPADALYAKMGLNDGIEYDVSGYGRNGTKVGTITHETDTPRYWTSSYFDGSSYILSDMGSFNWFTFNQCTIAAWINPSVSPTNFSGSFGISADGSSAYKQFSISNSKGKFVVHYNNGSYSIISSDYTLPLNEWHHCVAVLDGTTVKMYVDGELKKSETINWNSATTANDCRVQLAVDLPGGDETFKGCFSDARIYATSLSAEDILALYNNPVSLTSNGALMTQGEVTE